MTGTDVVTTTARTYETRDGLRLAADVWTVPDAAGTVLLLHGGGQTRHSWKSAGEHLAATGHTTVALDHRGHGDSDWDPAGNYDTTTIARDVVDVAAELDRPLVIVGASLGGLTGLQAAAWMGDDLRALVMVDVVPHTETAGVQRIHAFLGSAPEGFATLEEAADAIAAYMPHRPRRGVTPGLRKNLRLREDGRWHWHWDPQLLTQRGLPFGQQLDHLHELGPDLTMPVLLVRGMMSDVVSEAGVREFAATVPDARIVDLAGASHTAAADDNDAFTGAVASFISSLD
ncbi:hydrolase, alpha/beta domain protein [Aeromicrobium marinum DSM 15272]|uniref:Hydrolase, alpha/beta domain protein n=1 Tax=Aeromicrobium marinum DSM 15272 TaxID=585531 RepID=E2SDB0_9ACTN|nr:alpha/beta hydrolase [Aeromicrobium marinum]EFQ82487.1 hydrolase, alpha/beta domain protein [Aeromicrobium marinum DSM 15272]